MLKEIVTAIQSYFKAHQFISRHRLWKWIIIPGLVYMLLFCMSMYFFGKSASSVIEHLSNVTGLSNYLHRVQSSWLGFVFTLGGIMIWLLLMMFYFSLYKYIWLIIGSPLFAYLSEKTEALLNGTDFTFSWPQLIKDMVRGIRLSLRNALWQTVYALSILILSFVPVIGLVTPVVAMLVECYYYGFSMLDYSCERHQLTPSQSSNFISNRKGLAIGNGIVFYLMHLLPVIGWVLAPAYAVVAATISLYYQEKNA